MFHHLATEDALPPFLSQTNVLTEHQSIHEHNDVNIHDILREHQDKIHSTQSVLVNNLHPEFLNLHYQVTPQDIRTTIDQHIPNDITRQRRNPHQDPSYFLTTTPNPNLRPLLRCMIQHTQSHNQKTDDPSQRVPIPMI